MYLWHTVQIPTHDIILCYPDTFSRLPTAPPQQAHDEVNFLYKLQSYLRWYSPSQVNVNVKSLPADADPVVKKICTRPYQAPLYLTREALGQSCRERDELLLKGIIVQDPTGLARLAGTQRLYVPSPLQPLLLQEIS
ncbi:hypothetical protein FOZ60_014398 [Perkinsus olseni]|uniref:Uncharacterized protein n=1 Tax=Perkinsus olseni TaxID=32597 RepID=A0A7J6N8M9_PEROL|nr:hypothetical protein FOZ60_014398 [Perkinsus olseni]